MNEEELSGLPEGTIEAALFGEAKEGWIFTLDYPSYVPFTYADNRELRKKMAIALAQKVSRTMN
jgi:peptidyl-dipeptidase Dcp